MGGTTGPSPALSVFTWVSVTLNGPFTMTAGASLSVDPVTATLPEVPFSVHSGVPPAAGVAVGHPDAGTAGVVAMSVTAEEVAELDSVLEEHPAAITASRAVLTTMAERTREEFTNVTLHGRRTVAVQLWRGRTPTRMRSW